jgi:hypothetical protein
MVYIQRLWVDGAAHRSAQQGIKQTDNKTGNKKALWGTVLVLSTCGAVFVNLKPHPWAHQNGGHSIGNKWWSLHLEQMVVIGGFEPPTSAL